MDKTLLKGLRVLETLAASPQPMGVTTLSRALDLTKSNAHRTLQTLVAAGYARSNPETATYECTLKLFEVASTVVSRLDVRQIADPYLQQLAHATHESIHLSVLDGLDVIYLNKIESPQPVRAYSAIGGRAPAHCVASGKALLAWQSDDMLAGLPEDLAQWTPHTLNTRDALLADLAETRRRGFSINCGEWRDSVGRSPSHPLQSPTAHRQRSSRAAHLSLPPTPADSIRNVRECAPKLPGMWWK